MNQLQATFHLPDFIITEISRHVHQLYLTELNEEYHETWESQIREYPGFDGPIFMGVYSKVGVPYHSYHLIKITMNSRLIQIHFTIWHFKLNWYKSIYESTRCLSPKRYWYTSGNHRPDGYQ